MSKIHWADVAGAHRETLDEWLVLHPGHVVEDTTKITCYECMIAASEQIPFDWETLELLPFVEQHAKVTEQLQRNRLFGKKQQYHDWIRRHLEDLLAFYKPTNHG